MSMVSKIANKIEEYGIAAMVAVICAMVFFFAFLFIITKGWVLALFPPLGLFVIVKAYIDVKKDERKYMSFKAQREAENENQ